MKPKDQPYCTRQITRQSKTGKELTYSYKTASVILDDRLEENLQRLMQASQCTTKSRAIRHILNWFFEAIPVPGIPESDETT